MSQYSWIQPFDRKLSLEILRELALSHARLAGDTVLISYLTERDYASVCDYEPVYSSLTAYQAGNVRQACAFFSKYADLDLGVDKRQVAIDKFMQAERSCSETNDIFRARAQGTFLLEPWVESALFRAQQKIARALGDVPSLEVLKLRFGPGATTLTKKRNASIVEKLQAGISCSEDVLPWASQLLEELPHFAFSEDAAFYTRLSDGAECARVPVVLTDGVVEFVPKNSKTFRSIIKEGSLNTLIQLALGDFMSDRLLGVGLNLRDQSLNQELARKGSLDGSLATLDLSSASDTISTELVYSLLPIDWALLLDRARSSTVVLDGKRIRMEKFSSMGNGFTFPLESLIFWAISSSAVEGGFASVYGDDIIVPTSNVEKVMSLLKICGFTINQQKSYWQGPFRESCGADYLSGFDVRPCYTKKVLSHAELFRLHNYYVRREDWAHAARVKTLIPQELRLFGPDGFGDGHLLGDWSPRSHKRAESHGYGGVLFETYSLCSVRDERSGRKGDRVLPLYSVYIRENGPDVLDVSSPDSVSSLISYLRIRRKNILYLSPLEIPERRTALGDHVKCVSKPGTEGYRKVSIYTFNRV